MHHQQRHARNGGAVLRWLVLALLVGQRSAHVCAQDPPYRAYTTADGLPSNTVYWTLHDKEGFMWFGTDAGMSRFDGLHFSNYTTSDGLADNEVLGLFEDSQGRIWPRSLNGRVCYWRNGVFHGAREHPELGSLQLVSGISSIVEGLDGSIWFTGQGGGLYRWLNGQLTSPIMHDSCQPSSGHVIGQLFPSMHADPWLIANASMLRATAQGLQNVRCLDREVATLGMYGVWKNDRLCIHGDSLVRYTAAGTSLIIRLGAEQVRRTTRAPAVAENGDIWIPYSTGGVLWITTTPNGSHVLREVLRSVNVLASFDDPEGDRWLTTDGHGVIRIDPAQQRIGLLRVSDDLRQRGVTAVCATRSGRLLFGTAHGTLHWYAHGEQGLLVPAFTQYAARDRVRDIQEAGDGTLWFTTDMRCGQWKGPGNLRGVAQIDLRHPSPKLFHGGVKSLAPGPGGEMVAGSFGIGSAIDTLGGPTFVFRKNILSELQRIYAPFIARDGTLWFETNATLHRWRHGQDRTFPELVPLCGSRITDIDALSDGLLVLATTGHGVLLVDTNGRLVKVFDRAAGLPSDQCRAAVVRGNCILVATDEGAAMVDDPTGSAHVRVWSTLQGSPTSDVVDVDRIGDSLYLATPEGLCIVPLAISEHRSDPPRLRIARLCISDSCRTAVDSLDMPEGERLTVELLALTYQHPEAVRYAYASDADTVWHLLPGPDLVLAHLEPGDHHYRLRARKVDSDWCAPLDLHVRVVPPWYRSVGAKIGIALILLLAAAALVSLYMRRALRKERQVRERERTLQAERQRIAADIHDDLGADISHLLMLARQRANDPGLQDTDRDTLGTIATHASVMMQKIDEVIWSLDPTDDRLGTSLEFLQRFTETFAAEQGLGFRTRPIGTVPDHFMAGHERRELYLLLKELLHNIKKHTTAQNIRFDVHVTQQAVLIVLDDDGQVRTQAGPKRNGHGKNNIRTRITQLQGELRSEPIEPIGTRVTITLWLRWIPQL